MATQVGQINRTASDYSTTVHEIYSQGVAKNVAHSSPIAGVFESLGDGGVDLRGEKFQFAVDFYWAGGGMATDGYLPDHEEVAPIEASYTPVRCYLRRAVDNFMAERVTQPGAYEDLMARIGAQQWEAIQIMTSRHVHGSTNGTVCTFVSRTSGTVLVVDAGYGYAGVRPTMYLRQGMTLALLDASNSYATIGVAAIDSIAHNTSATTSTITFAATIDGSSTGADGDPLVFATTNDSSATHYVVERNYAPLGLLDIIDPAAATASLAGIAESSYDEWKPYRFASSDFGHIEFMEFVEGLRAKSLSAEPITAQSHVFSCQAGVQIELAKDLLGYQQQSGLGGKLQGGWDTVMVGPHRFLVDDYHIPDVLYAHCPEDLFVSYLGGPPSVWSGDGSQYARLADYDGKEWFIRVYLCRGAMRRNKLGCMTGISVSNSEDYAAVPGTV